MSHVLVFTDGTFARISVRTAEALEMRLLDESLDRNKTAKVPTLDGENFVRKYYSMDGVYTESMWEEMLHAKNGDWKCKSNQWHPKGQSCGHVVQKQSAPFPGLKPPESDVSPNLIPAKTGSTQVRERVAQNLAQLKITGRYGDQGLTEEQILEREARRIERREIAARYKARNKLPKSSVDDKVFAKMREADLSLKSTSTIAPLDPTREFQG